MLDYVTGRAIAGGRYLIEIYLSGRPSRTAIKTKGVGFAVQDVNADNIADLLALCLLSSISDSQRPPIVGSPELNVESSGPRLERQALPGGLCPSRSDHDDKKDPPAGLPETVLAGDQPKTRRPPLTLEPMLFDFMRPLGAERGELEANALVRPSIGGQGATWAPEVEFAVAPGHTVEIELPFEGGRLEAFKLGFQGTLGAFRQNRSTHGWQALIERARGRRRLQLDALHLAGRRVGQRWSALIMQGAP
ncbi:MAG: hypothetical protein CFK52_07450 [Chloracidobacterium sp. CP2_5A]|nr:MAG: hypothetical protein CFK52_07450 [Chloracidobacterium sp. CP2_5A]